MNIVAANSGAKNARALNEATAQATQAERERVRQVLHDGLGQLLTSISFLAGSLRQKLAERGLPEENDAAEILLLTSRAMGETQSLVHGPLPKSSSKN